MRFVPACYAGIKQRREPMLAAEYEGELFELAEAKPAAAPSDAGPPNRAPRNVSAAGMFV